MEECRRRALEFDDALLIATITEVSDIANIEETLSTRAPHEEIIPSGDWRWCAMRRRIR